MLYTGHLVTADTFLWNGQAMVKLLSKNSFIGDTFIADTVFWHHMKCSSQIHLLIAGTSYFLWENKNKLLFNIQNVFIWHTHTHTHTQHTSLLLYFVNYLLVSFSEFSITFAGTNFDRIVRNTQNSRNLLPLKTI